MNLNQSLESYVSMSVKLKRKTIVALLFMQLLRINFGKMNFILGKLFNIVKGLLTAGSFFACRSAFNVMFYSVNPQFNRIFLDNNNIH